MSIRLLASNVETSTSAVLALGEVGVDTATGLLRIGDGTSAWSALTPVSPSGASSTAVKEEGSTVVAAASALNFVGASVTVTDGGGGTAIITITDATLTQEQVEDFIGGLWADSSVIDVTYNDAGGIESATIVAGSVTNAMLAGSIALSKLATDPLDRANHTGTQAESTVVNLVSDLAAKAPAARTVNTQTGDYTLVLADATAIVAANKATAIAVTVPPNSSVAFPIGTEIPVTQLGVGLLTIVAGGGVTINGLFGLVSPGQYAMLRLVKRATDTWNLSGPARGELGYAELSSNYTNSTTSYTAVSGLSVTVTVGVRPILVRLSGLAQSTNLNNSYIQAQILDETPASIGDCLAEFTTSSITTPLFREKRLSLAAGTIKTFTVQAKSSSSSSQALIFGAAPNNTFLQVLEV